MNDAPYIPQKTVEELTSAHPEGSRHAAIIKIAYSLIGNRLPPEAVFATIRSQFDSDKTDREIRDVIDWCIAKNPTPSTPMNGAPRQNGAAFPGVTYSRPSEKPKKSKEEIEVDALALSLDFIGEDQVDIQGTVERSLVDIGEFSTHSETLFMSLYQPGDTLNVVCDFTVNEKGKANPRGGGKTLTRDEWISYFKSKGTPESKAGAWIRPNVCRPGSGKDGAITDADIIRHDFMLIESDFLPLDVQLSFYAKWKLPVAAILTSGGDSAHAWVKLSAPDKGTYDEWVKRILDSLKLFGFDQSNKNPSRLSRLPGATRVIGASGEGKQRLLYANPLTESFTLEALQSFEKQVSPPFLNRYPLRDTQRASIERYDELKKNVGKTGLQTGLPSFDRDTGGLKRGSLIVLAAETNVGKSALALNMINRALNDGCTCALFTLEMDRDEIYDLLISMNLRVNRNVFNTGNFSDEDMLKIANGSSKIGRFPLHVFDDPAMTIEDIDRACSKLVEDFDLRLVVVDYLQLVSPPAVFRDSREQQIAHIGRCLRVLAKRCRVPVIALSQLNEDGKIRESRAVTHDAHIVFILSYEKNELFLRTVKGRSIPKKTYELFFDGNMCRMGEMEKIREEDIPRKVQ